MSDPTRGAFWPDAEPVEARVWIEEWHGVAGSPVSLESTPSRFGGILHRLKSGTAVGAGAVVVAQRADGAVLMVRQDRVAPGVQLWELPRGIADDIDEDLCATGARELEEETGALATATMLLGRIYPDSGILAASVGVVIAQVDGEAELLPIDGEVDCVDWIPEDEIDLMIISGSLRDGISLSALMLWRAWRADADRVATTPS